ncbi:MAG TPA: hypothetical protein VLF69_04445 [Candidatus Saccharimonadales bacterium]|nr:hypothetical protein [Candidatus Saccharimonadales bacterium]
MEKRIIGQTKNGKTVYVATQSSHAATHIADTPRLLELVQEIVGHLAPNEDNVYVDKDMGRPVGLSDLVETGETDKILYAKRLNRDNYTRFVRNRKAEPTNFVTVVLHKDPEDNYELWSAWIGTAAPQFPGDEFETPQSRLFWQRHALVWGNQAVQPSTEREDWPWN